MRKNYYKILQVDPSAEQEVVEGAYKRLAQKYHPDHNASADAKVRMQEINEAHDVLKDRNKRKEYDREFFAQDTANSENSEAVRQREDNERKQKEQTDNQRRQAEAERQREEQAQKQREQIDAEQHRAEYEKRQREQAEAERQRVGAEVQRKKAIGQCLRLAGLAVLFVGILATFVPNWYPPGAIPPNPGTAFLQQYWAPVSFIALLAGFLCIRKGNYYIRGVPKVH